MKTLPHYRHHEHLHRMSDDQLQVCVPLSLHADGAEFYSNEEYFVWSWSSAFAVLSSTNDILYQKFPIAVVAMRDMQDEHAPLLGLKVLIY